MSTNSEISAQADCSCLTANYFFVCTVVASFVLFFIYLVID